jgi:phosphate:Na+ symporter
MESSIERALDPAALANPVVAVEAGRRVVAEGLSGLSASVAAALAEPGKGAGPETATAPATLEKVRTFLSELHEPPETDAERARLTGVLHALDHASRLADILGDGAALTSPAGAPDDLKAAELCGQVMRWTQRVDEPITREASLSPRAEPIDWGASPEVGAALKEAESAAKALSAMLPDHRAALLASVAAGQATAADAFARIETARRLERIAHHAWRSAAHLLGLGERVPSPSMRGEG